MEQRFVIKPHPDIELGFERKELEYFLTFPDKPINQDTGLILAIPGFGDRADSDYQRNKLRPYLAGKYNCLVAGVNYFGIGIKGPKRGFNYITAENLPALIDHIYGISPGSYMVNTVLRTDLLAETLKQKGIKRLDTLCRLIRTYAGGEYQSFGFLPAVDCLAVVGDVFRRYGINRKKIVAFGSSYGGYIALLLGKFAPKTFSRIIDNSGFVKVCLSDVAGKEFMSHEHILIDGVGFPYAEDTPWTIIDDASPNYFSDDCKSIRSVIKENHVMESDAKYCIFHSENDQLVKVQEKRQLVRLLESKSISVYYKEVNKNDIDGKVFKTLDHGMEASLRGLFDLAAGVCNNDLHKSTDTNDFDLNSTYTYDCGGKSYTFSFFHNFEIHVELRKN